MAPIFPQPSLAPQKLRLLMVKPSRESPLVEISALSLMTKIRFITGEMANTLPLAMERTKTTMFLCGMSFLTTYLKRKSSRSLR